MKKSHKMILAGLSALLVITGIAWKLAAPRVLAGVQDLLLKQVNSSINGRLEIGSLDFSVLGSAVLKQVVLYGQHVLHVMAKMAKAWREVLLILQHTAMRNL